LVKLLGYFPGKKVGFAGTESKNVILDWSYNSRTGKYKLLNSSINFEDDFQNIKLPVLAISFQKDKLAPQNAVKRLSSKMKNALVKYVHYEKDDLDHFNWVKNNNNVVEKIQKWIDH